MYKNYHIEYVEWKDPTSHNLGWVELEEYAALKPSICKSVGWIVYEDLEEDGTMAIVPHVTTDEKGRFCEGGGDVVIPKSLIVKRTRLCP